MKSVFCNLDEGDVTDPVTLSNNVGKLVWAGCGCCSETSYVPTTQEGLTQLMKHQLDLIKELKRVTDAILVIQSQLYKGTV